MKIKKGDVYYGDIYLSEGMNDDGTKRSIIKGSNVIFIKLGQYYIPIWHINTAAKYALCKANLKPDGTYKHYSNKFLRSYQSKWDDFHTEFVQNLTNYPCKNNSGELVSLKQLYNECQEYYLPEGGRGMCC